MNQESLTWRAKESIPQLLTSRINLSIAFTHFGPGKKRDNDFNKIIFFIIIAYTDVNIGAGIFSTIFNPPLPLLYHSSKTVQFRRPFSRWGPKSSA